MYLFMYLLLYCIPFSNNLEKSVKKKFVETSFKATNIIAPPLPQKWFVPPQSLPQLPDRALSTRYQKAMHCLPVINSCKVLDLAQTRIQYMCDIS